MSFECAWGSIEQIRGKVFQRKKSKKTKSNDTSTFTFLTDQTENVNKEIEETQKPDTGNSSASFNPVENESHSQQIAKETAICTDNKIERRKNTNSSYQGKKNVAENNLELSPKKYKKFNKFTTKNDSTSKLNSHKFSLFPTQEREIYVDSKVPTKPISEQVFSNDQQKFCDIGIHKHLVANLDKLSYTTLTYVQQKAMPKVLNGDNVLVRSQTGSGKTLVFAVPILNCLQSIQPKLKRSDGVQAIIVVPTRELALQTHELFGKINTFQWIIAGHLCGGESRKSEKDRIRKGVHILIGTPGRLLDHILHTVSMRKDQIKWLVLDEADRLLDMGYQRDIMKIVEEIDRSTIKNQTKRQTILLSATLTAEITELTNFTMDTHTYVDTQDENTVSISCESNMIIPDCVKQEYIITYAKHKLFTLVGLILHKSLSAATKMFIFMATSQMVDFYYELFNNLLKTLVKKQNINMNSNYSFNGELFKLHGFMDQSARKQVFSDFRKANVGILFCTDVAARGIDVPSADCVIQFTAPQTDEAYVHRVGRTGRVGKSGNAILFLTHEEQDYVGHLRKQRVLVCEKNISLELKQLCELTCNYHSEEAASIVQRFFENSIIEDEQNLQRLASLAFTSWSRFYHTYPSQMRKFFDFRKANLGHYATCFALREPPSSVLRRVKQYVKQHKETNVPKRLNQKLNNHGDDSMPIINKKRPINSISLSTCEFGDGLQPIRKKRK